MHLNEINLTEPSFPLYDLNDLSRLLEGEPEFEAQDQLHVEKAKSIQEQGIETLLTLIRRGHSIHLRFSGGKDSSACAVLVIEAVRRASEEEITTTHHISSSSTQIDNPAMEMHLLAVQDEMREHFAKCNLPIAPLARLNSSTLGQVKIPQAGQPGL